MIAALLIACDREGTPAAAPSASPSASASATATASATPTTLPTGPAGYATSCAGAIPWGKQVTQPFVCIDFPAKGASVSRGGGIVVRGYAGGSFENNVVVEVRTVTASGALSAPVVQKPKTYTAPDVGMPGFWTVDLAIPAGQPASARVIAHFDSPKDGARVAEASVDITLR